MLKRVRRRRLSIGRAIILRSFIEQYGWQFGAELGVLRGDTLVDLLEHCHDLHMIGVDAWSDKHYLGKRSPEEFHKMVRDAVRPFDNRVELMKMTTVEAASYFDDCIFNFVFIDADHSLEGVTADIIAWSPKVRKDGWIIGHDYQRRFPGVIQAVNEYFPNARKMSDSVWACPRAESSFS